jgi:DNA-binding MarR family transcriptional regulator
MSSSSTATAAPAGPRHEAVEGLFQELIQLGRTLRSRGADWGHVDPELSRGDIVTLGVLEARGAIRCGQVAAVLAVDPSVVSRQLAPLTHLGLVERHPDPADGRAELVSLTAAGRHRLLQARSALCAALAERLADHDPGEIDGIAAVLGDLTQRLQQPLTPAQKLDHHV